MYHPTTRLLTILELLQIHRQMSGEELAERLEVDTRSVRRYILMLQELGMPIEGARGPGGGYRLRPGFHLPPLLFTEEEATALVLGLLGTPWLEIELSATAVEGALAKVARVLPMERRERVQAISAAQLLYAQRHEGRPEVSLLIRCSEATQQHRRMSIEYCSHHNEVTQRQIEPYSIVGSKGHWYIAGYCILRQEYRLFRLDRIQSAEVLPETFSPAKDFDCQAFVIERLATIPARWIIEVEFQAELYIVKQKIPLTHGNFTTTPTGVLFQSHHNHLPTMARYLIGLDLPFVIRNPPELRDALLQLAEEMLRIAQAR
jgi:predicted DNA-binding transcriptional regulator YafY